MENLSPTLCMLHRVEVCNHLICVFDDTVGNGMTVSIERVHDNTDHTAQADDHYQTRHVDKHGSETEHDDGNGIIMTMIMIMMVTDHTALADDHFKPGKLINMALTQNTMMMMMVMMTRTMMIMSMHREWLSTT